ncbi:MAG TPA: twin-arginine translocase TatA/TatE family subunit [Bacteroidetes bacterium]|nr:twin-arginine translocase TatA/TatE family subunit [Bacteroidota bacterium]
MGIGGLGPTELLIIFFIVLLIFGGSKLPGLAKGLGTGIKEFKKAVNGKDEESKSKKEIPEADEEKK